MITAFKNINSTNTPHHLSIEKEISRIKLGSRSIGLIDRIRKEKDKEKRSELKKDLPSICFGGYFKYRSIDGLVYSSGYMTLDYDDIPNKKEFKKLWDQLKSIPFTRLVFRSPSFGVSIGIKAIIKIPKDINAEKYRKIFEAFQGEYPSDYWDKSNSDISRVCYESYDPKLYDNPDAEIFDPKIEDKGYSVSEKLVYTPLTDEDKIISRIMEWNWKYDFVDGERNTFTYALSRMFCEYGVSEQGSINFIVNHFSEDNFKEREISNTVKSAYKKSEFGIKNFVDYDKKKKLDEDLRHKQKYKVIEEYNLDDEEYERLKEYATADEFWHIEENKSGEKKVKADPYKYKIFLEQNGFKKTYLNDSQKPTFVKVTSNVVEETSIEKIKDFVLNFLLEKRLIKVWNYFSSYSTLFSDQYLLMIESIDLIMLDDKKYKSFIAFKNGILEVTKDSTNLIDYLDVDGYVWKSHIINEDFEKDKMDNDYQKFIKNISHKSAKPLESTIGYLLSTYKNKTNNKAVILNDEKISDDPEGGTGKGVVIQGLRKIRRVAILDGKTFDDKKSFPYQTISKDTQILVFDDVKKNWVFESKFSIVTEGITLERKNKDAIKLTVEQSPKMVITTNYVIPGSGNSHARRRHEIEIAQYYGENRTPYDDFGCQLFDDWDSDHFRRFYNYMVYCLQLYLKEGLVSQSDAKNIESRKLIAETNKEFFEWANDGNLPTNERLYRSEKYNNFVNEYPDYRSGRYQLSQKSFKIYIDKYASFLGLESKSDQDVNGRYTEILDPNKEKEENNEVPF